MQHFSEQAFMRVGEQTIPSSGPNRELFTPTGASDPRRSTFDPRRDLLRAFEDGKRRGRYEAFIQAIVVGVMSGLAAAVLAFWIIQSLSTID
jgi:hypothetical protein